MELVTEVRHSYSLKDAVANFPSIVGVSNQISWIAIGITSIRFRAALERQGKTHLLPFRNWTYPWGPYISVALNIFLVLIQGWSCFSPTFNAIDFVSYYVEIPVMVLMYVIWKLVKRTQWVRLEEMDLETDTHTLEEEKHDANPDWKTKFKKYLTWFV
jgi:AAT family amino acid transporter